MSKLNEIIELSKDDNHISEITTEKLVQAKAILLTTSNNNKELLNVLVAMNLINAALKRKEFKSKEKDALIHYGLLKPRVSRLFRNLLENRLKFDIDFYINQQEKCAYIEIEGLQFSFHNITIDEPLKAFINSPLNNPKPWKGIRLQKIAGELFDYSTKKEA
ncbi:hypothetical protein [Myroides odoratimimus]|uniref:hypothetical protein n=1 Tax=Myroides odoratimimus TaxID=76832 RepID=UPI002DBA4BA1|nr:hypothetical protein [Myroides odoratimimus]MEC4036820.1 hypothetical protein [Myroides odoratimimus]